MWGANVLGLAVAVVWALAAVADPAGMSLGHDTATALRWLGGHPKSGDAPPYDFGPSRGGAGSGRRDDDDVDGHTDKDAGVALVSRLLDLAVPVPLPRPPPLCLCRPSAPSTTTAATAAARAKGMFFALF